MEEQQRNGRKPGGALLALVPWLLSALLYPYLPEVVYKLWAGMPLSIFFGSWAEPLATFGFFFAILGIPWLPAAIKAELLKRRQGHRAARNYVLRVLAFVSVLYTALMLLIYSY